MTSPNLSDPLLSAQWYLINTGQRGGDSRLDINVLPAWQAGINGSGVVVAINDDGLDLTHPDLAANIDVTKVYDTSRGTTGQGFVGTDNSHGTVVGSIVGMVANGIGGVGVAYKATLVPALAIGATSAFASANLFKANIAAGVDVSVNSWGADPAFAENFGQSASEEDRAWGTELLRAATEGRKGLGMVIEVSAGNERGNRADAGLSNFTGNKVTIAVGSVDQTGVATEYSTPGASLLLVAFGGVSSADQSVDSGFGAVSADIQSSGGYNNTAGDAGNYAFQSQGTSYSGPMVGGAAALLLQANPALGFRDVSAILAMTARQTDATNQSWVVNGSKNWNLGGMHFSRDYGYGILDVAAAVRLAQSWTAPSSTAANWVSAASPAMTTAAQLIPDDGAKSLTVTAQVTDNVRIDRVEFDLNVSATSPSQLKAEITSPSGTTITLFDRPLTKALKDGQPDPAATESEWPGTFTIGSTAFLGESSGGTWTLKLTDLVTGTEASFNSLVVRAWGSAPSADDQYVLTNEFNGNRTLTDASGVDTLNAAAIDRAVKLSLGGVSSLGTDGTINLGQGTVIENAIGGLGPDTLEGNDASNVLRGNAGNDSMSGGLGNDLLDGGDGDDLAIYPGSRSDFTISFDQATKALTISSSSAGTDTVVNVESFRFMASGVTMPLSSLLEEPPTFTKPPVSSARNAPFVTEAYARSINTAVLFIDGDGNWKVGEKGQKVAQYKAVSASGTATVNDDTLELTALTAEKRDEGGYLVYAQSNDDLSSYVEITLDGSGAVTGQRTLTLEQLFAAEVKYGIDLNDNGGIGSQLVLADDGQADLYIDGAGAYVVKTPKGDTIPLTFDGQPLTIYNLDDYEFSEVFVEDDGSLTSVVENPSGGFFKVVSSAAGSSSPPQPMTPEELAARETKSGVDVNRDSSKALAPDWTAVLKTSTLRQEVEAQLVQGGKISHTGLLKIIDTVLQSLQASGAAKVGADLVADLREMGARGQTLFTSKDLAGNDTTYLSYVFDKMVNASKANNTFTGGQSKILALGNLSAESAPAQLAQLRDKWLLGKDLPNPTTQGDTANPNAAAATGLYQTFTADLFVGGANLLDVNQGSTGTCYLLAALAGVANSAPSALQSTFVSSGSIGGNRVWGVRFYDTAGKEVWVTSNDQLVVSEPGADTASYAKATGRDANGNVVPELWVPLLEKAYAQANELGAFGRQNDANAMFAIEGGMAEAVSNVVGGRMTWLAEQAYSSINGNPLLSAITAPAGSSILAEVAKAINAGQVVWVSSDNKTTDASGATLWTKGHAFLALDPDPNNPNDTQIRVYNPWGFSAASAQSPNPSFVSPFLVDLASVAGVTGYDFYVQVWGSAKDDVIFGVEAGDRLDGAGGNDVLRGLGGNDTLLGGPGNDVISGGPGNDSIDAGEGDDVVIYPGDRSQYTITVDETGKITTVTSASEGTDTIVNVERFQFGASPTAVSFSALNDKTPPSVTAANPLTGAKQVALDASLKFTFNEPIQLGKGAIVLKTSDGKTVETFTAANATVSGNTLTLKPSAKFQVFTSYSVDFSSTAVQDLAGNAFSASKPYSLKSATVDGLYHFFVVAFAAAPGATYMGQLAEAVNFGLSLPQIVEIFTTKPQFTSVYPTAMSNRELATVLVNNIVKISASEAARNQAISDIETVLSPEIGWSRGKMLFTVFGNLASKPLTDPTWGGTAKQFQNQLAVARYFTEEMGVQTETLSTLRGVIGNVTPDTDVSTIDKIVQIIGTIPPGG